MKNLTKDIYDRLTTLDARHCVVFGQFDNAAPCQDRAKALEKGLRAADADAVKAVTALIDAHELENSPRFWMTSLGRLLFAAGGYPKDKLTQTQAAGVLGCSRQYVHELISRGKIEPSPRFPAMVQATSVRRILIGKLDELVK